MRGYTYLSLIVIAVMLSSMAMLAFSAGEDVTVRENTRYVTHAPIEIHNDTDLVNQAASEGWPGDGSASNPYIISGYEIDGADGIGIYIADTTLHFVIEDCMLYNATHGLSFKNVQNGTVRGNVMRDNDLGMYSFNGSYFVIENNTVTDSYKYGISFFAGRNSIIRNNTIMNNGDGIVMGAGRNNVIVNNTITANRRGILIDSNSVNIEIKNNKLSQSWDVHIWDSYAILVNNDMTSGVYLKGNKSVFLNQQIDTSNTVGGKPLYYYKNVDNLTFPTDAGEIIAANVRDVKIENVNIANAYVNVEIGYSERVYILNSSFDGAHYGVDLYYVNNSVVDNCTFSHNYMGITLMYSNHNLLSNSTYSFNSNKGMYLGTASYNQILHNMFFKNLGLGLYVSAGSSYNLIYNNSFYYNSNSGDTFTSSKQAIDYGSSNYWDSSSRGNYWHDWANNNDTNDQNGDGIVDWPYTTGLLTDHYPLKNPTYLAPPLPPKGLYAFAGDLYVNLSWDAPEHNGSAPVTSYRIYRDGALIAEVPATQLWYNDTDVVNDVTYTYYVTAVSSVGESEASEKVSAMPTGAIPELSMLIVFIVFLAAVLLFKKR